MKVSVIKCDECGAYHDETQEKFKDRKYIAFDNHHFCKNCAKKITLFDAIQKIVERKE